MANADELRDRKEEESEKDEEKQRRLDDAIAAREHEQEYQGDLDAARQEADKAEERVDNPDA